MTKDEMKDKISMTLKDPILQQGFEIIYKENTELKEKISILLSCKNCPENKGGWICAKEYENKCLAQKIEFIKELEKENAKLKKQVENRNCSNCRLNKTGCPNDGSCHNFSLWQPFINPKLTKAKEIIKKFLEFVNNEDEFDSEHPQEHTNLWNELCEQAERFIKE